MIRRARERRKANQQDFTILSIDMALRRALYMVYQQPIELRTAKRGWRSGTCDIMALWFENLLLTTCPRLLNN